MLAYLSTLKIKLFGRERGRARYNIGETGENVQAVQQTSLLFSVLFCDRVDSRVYKIIYRRLVVDDVRNYVNALCNTETFNFLASRNSNDLYTTSSDLSITI